MNCFVTVKGIPYTKEEFKKLVAEGGLSALAGESPSPLAQILLTRFDLDREDSVYEMLAKLQLQKQQLSGKYKGVTEITGKLAKELIYPQGATNSYRTQAAIHKNTYSGVKLTGIGANFMKALSYVFEMGTPSSVIDENGVETFKDTPEFDALLDANKVRSINELLWANQNYRVGTRQKVNIKPVFRYGSYAYNAFSRFEIDAKTGKKKVIYREGDEDVYYNIFETFDTIVNLAIDNIKEQKLFVLGITNSNANAFLSAISLGVPLSDVALIFNSPLVSKLSQERTFNADQTLENIKEKLLKSYTDAEIANAARIIDPSFSQTGGADILSRVTGITINTALLTQQYTGELGSDTILSELHDYVVLSNIKNLSAIGNEFFAYSKIFKALRHLPNNYTDVDSTIKEVEGITTSKSERNRKAILRREYYTAAEIAITQSEEYLALDETQRPKYLADKMAQVKNSEASKSESENLYRQDYNNRVLNRMVAREFDPTPDSILQNGSPLNIPHVFSVYHTLIKLRRAMEASFAIHSPLISQFAESVLDSVNLKGRKSERMEAVKTEFIKFISSSLTLNLLDQELELEVPDDFLYGDSRGKEAWAAQFIDKVVILQNTEDNAFLNFLEVRTNKDGYRSVSITSDKSSDPESLEYVREAFLEFMNSNPDLALDFFKYAIMDQGLFFSRTSLALIFPASFAAEFSTKLEGMLSNILPKDSRGVKTGLSRANLDTIKEAFIYQFLRNNPDAVQYPGFLGDPKIFGKYYNYKGDKVALYSGVDENTQFDLMYSGDPMKAPKIINRYGKIYIKIKVYEAGKVYYRRLSSKTYTSAYAFSTSNLNTSFSFDKFTDPSLKFEDMKFASLQGKRLVIPTEDQKYNIGDVVYLFDYTSPNPNSALKVEIISAAVSSDKKGHTYKYRTLDSADFNKENSYQGELSAIANVRSSAFRSVKAQSMKDAVNVKRDLKSRSILVADEGGDLNLNLSAYKTGKPSEVTEQIIAKINSMEIKAATLIIPLDILSRVASSHPLQAYKVALAIYEKTGIDLPVLGINVNAEYDNAANIFELRTRLSNISTDISRFPLNYSKEEGGFIFETKKLLEVGDIYHHSGDKFFYMESVTDKGKDGYVYVGVPVPLKVMETLQSYSLPKEEFYAIVQNFKDNSCALT